MALAPLIGEESPGENKRPNPTQSDYQDTEKRKDERNPHLKDECPKRAIKCGVIVVPDEEDVLKNGGGVDRSGPGLIEPVVNFEAVKEGVAGYSRTIGLLDMGGKFERFS